MRVHFVCIMYLLCMYVVCMLHLMLNCFEVGWICGLCVGCLPVISQYCLLCIVYCLLFVGCLLFLVLLTSAMICLPPTHATHNSNQQQQQQQQPQHTTEHSG